LRPAPHAGDRCWGRRGCGRSGREGPWNGETYTADLDALRRHWRHDRRTLLGHSAGAELALAYAIRHPEHVTGLVLLSSYTKAVDPDAGAKYRANWRARLPATTLEEYDRLANADGDAATHARQRLRGQTDMGDMSMPAPVYREDWINNEINRDLVLPWVTAETIGGIQARAVVIHGAGDPRPADTARQLAHTLPRGSYIEIPQVGHYPWLEQPERLRGVLRSAVQQVAQACDG
jgi:proline iminopeptidase